MNYSVETWISNLAWVFLWVFTELGNIKLEKHMFESSMYIFHFPGIEESIQNPIGWTKLKVPAPKHTHTPLL